MKIQCDVCENQEASVFCTADEAALCEMCDNKVHHANKLASKHLRFSLHHPSFKEAPLCDICQEKRAFLFCKEDRAILCRECDIPIHKSNEHTQNHNRYILTGVKISNSLATYPNTSNLSSSDNSSSPNFISHTKISSITNVSSEHNTFNQHSYNSNNTSMNTISTPSSSTMNYNPIYEEGSISTSNMIPENLMENLPGWRLEDLLDSSSACFNHDF